MTPLMFVLAVFGKLTLGILTEHLFLLIEGKYPLII